MFEALSDETLSHRIYVIIRLENRSTAVQQTTGTLSGTAPPSHLSTTIRYQYRKVSHPAFIIAHVMFVSLFAAAGAVTPPPVPCLRWLFDRLRLRGILNQINRTKQGVFSGQRTLFLQPSHRPLSRSSRCRQPSGLGGRCGKDLIVGRPGSLLQMDNGDVLNLYRFHNHRRFVVLWLHKHSKKICNGER